MVTLTCPFDHLAPVPSTERYNAGRITRQRQDEFSARSHQLAAAAMASGKFAEEIVGVAVPQRKGDAFLIDTDDGGVAGCVAARLREGRHNNRRQRFADFRRRCSGDRNVR